MRHPRIALFLLLLPIFLNAACTGPAVGATAPVMAASSEPPVATTAAAPSILADGDAPSPRTPVQVEADGQAPEESPPQRQAVEACQAADELLGHGDQAGALTRIDEAYEAMLQIPDDGDGEQAKQDVRRLVAALISRVYAVQPATAAGPTAPSWDLSMPTADNEEVGREIRSFTSRERDELLAAYRRAGRYRPMILAKLEAAGLPSQLSWLPIVESFFQPLALSHAGALGLWQFISSTGLRYGLRRDDTVDERLDPEKATDAAVAYLADLHRLFGDWPKALAAYNCGEMKVAQVQQRWAGRFVDFWELYALLPRETRRYVPRFIAVMELFANPERHGLTLPEPDAAGAAVRVAVDRPVRLLDLDRTLGLVPGTLAGLNPSLRVDATPRRGFELVVPEAAAGRVVEAVAALPDHVPLRTKAVVHRVRTGETLSQIAARYYTSVGAIMRSNRLRSADRIWPGQRLVIPERG